MLIARDRSQVVGGHALAARSVHSIERRFDLDAALAYIATPNRSPYQTARVNLGTAITGLTGHWRNLQTVELAASYAIFNVTQNLGENLQYQIVMVKEDGQWRVDLFWQQRCARR